MSGQFVIHGEFHHTRGDWRTGGKFLSLERDVYAIGKDKKIITFDYESQAALVAEKLNARTSIADGNGGTFSGMQYYPPVFTVAAYDPATDQYNTEKESK